MTFDTIDDVIKDMTRLREIAFTTGIFNLLTKDLTPMQRAVYKIMFETYHDLGGWGPYLPILQYEEVVLRALFTTHPRGKALEKETDEDDEENEDAEYDEDDEGGYVPDPDQFSFGGWYPARRPQPVNSGSPGPRGSFA